MQQANARLKISRFTDVPVTGLTPAEQVVLHIIHSANVGEEPIFDIKPDGEAQVEAGREDAVPAVGKPGDDDYEPAVPEKVECRPRTNAEELRRLRSKYGALTNKKGDKIIKLIWPGMDAALPQKFEDVKLKELQFDGTDVGTTDFGTSNGVAVNQ